MSKPKTIAGKIIQAIVSLFIKKSKDALLNVAKDMPDQVKEKIKPIVWLVSQINIFVNSPAMDFLTAVIPGQADDQFKEWARAVLPVVLDKLNLSVSPGKSIVLPDLSTISEVRGTQLKDIGSFMTMRALGTDVSTSRIMYDAVYKEAKQR